MPECPYCGYPGFPHGVDACRGYMKQRIKELEGRLAQYESDGPPDHVNRTDLSVTEALLSGPKALSSEGEEE